MGLDIHITLDHINVTETRTDRVFIERTKEWIDVPYEHSRSVALGDYAIREGDDVLLAADQLIEAGKMLPEDRPVLAASYNRPIIGYDTDRYLADLSAKLEAAVGKDFAPVVAGLAIKTEMIENIRQQVVAMTEASKAEKEATLDLASKLRMERDQVEAARTLGRAEVERAMVDLAAAQGERATAEMALEASRAARADATAKLTETAEREANAAALLTVAEATKAEAEKILQAAKDIADAKVAVAVDAIAEPAPERAP